VIIDSRSRLSRRNPVHLPSWIVNWVITSVQAGDTLFSISRRYGYTPAQVAEWNGLPPPYTLSIGQMLLVSPPRRTFLALSPLLLRPAASDCSQCQVAVAGNMLCRAGETLFSIARRYGHTVEQVASWNYLTPPYTLSVGQRLIGESEGQCRQLRRRHLAHL
jgi:peptidoglycan DL-endopeptidase LytF